MGNCLRGAFQIVCFRPMPVEKVGFSAGLNSGTATTREPTHHIEWLFGPSLTIAARRASAPLQHGQGVQYSPRPGPGAGLAPESSARPTRIAVDDPDHLSTRQYARIVKTWVTAIGLDPTMQFLRHAFHSGMRHIKLMNFYYCCVWRSLISGHGEAP